MMGISKTEINLRRLLSAAPNQQNQSKLMHYVATLREQLEQLSEEKTPEGLPRVTKAKVNEYYEKIEAVASKIASQVPETEVSDEAFAKDSSISESSPRIEDDPRSPTSPQLRRRIVKVSTSSKEQSYDAAVDADPSKPIKLDAAAQALVEKNRNLQDGLTDEMVTLARQLKERSLLINQSVQNTDKLLDSTEEAIEQSLAGTGHANVRASKIYSQSSKTSCFQWLLILVMTFIFIMVVLLIRVT
uniref:Vesicle transport protein USE1 n=1 Tax=Noccaea caerulescens TaxID=107243 RepID=A0A1J3FL15_NOCCA